MSQNFWKQIFKYALVILDLLAIGLVVIINGISLIPAVWLGIKIFDWVDSIYVFALLAPLCYFVYLVSYIVTNAFFRKILIRKLVTGKLEPFDPRSLRWFRNMLFATTHENFVLANIKFYNILKHLHFRLTGAKIDFRANLAVNNQIYESELVTIGRGTMAGLGSFISGHMRTKDYLLVGEVKIGKNCIIGGRSMISPNVVIEDEATVGAQCFVAPGAKIEKGATLLSNSVLPSNQVVLANQTWGGIPARPIKKDRS
jgi:acetyltransferase-like isoleucine patch superfamily enzyme